MYRTGTIASKLKCKQHIPQARPNIAAQLLPHCAGHQEMTTAEASELSQDMHLAAGHSMAQITPGGLRLYDAEGSCSMVPLDELKQIMGKLSFSRCRCRSLSILCSSTRMPRSADWLDLAASPLHMIGSRCCTKVVNFGR